MDGNLIARDNPAGSFAGTGGFYLARALGSYYQGLLNEVRVWSAALDQPTIQAWMDSTLTPAHPDFSYLLAWWPVDEGVGNTVADETGNGDTGLLIDGPVWTDIDFSSWSVSAALGGLTAGTTYQFRLVADNISGNSTGQNAALATVAGVRPAVVTLAPGVNSGANTAVLNGSVLPNGLETMAWFQYGPDTNYGNVTARQDVGNGDVSPGLLGAPINHAMATHYRIVAQSRRRNLRVNGGQPAALERFGLIRGGRL